MTGPDIVAVEARIARQLSDLTTVRDIDGQRFLPPSYVRRHLVEHASAGQSLNRHTIPESFLPYLDLVRLRDELPPVARRLPNQV